MFFSPKQDLVRIKELFSSPYKSVHNEPILQLL